MHKRVEWVDVAKGLGIFLVAIGHAPLPAPLAVYIFSFHMPLFFFLSGYLFKESKYKSFRPFLKRRVNSIVIPYFIFAFGMFTVYVLRAKVFGDPTANLNLLTAFVGIFYSVGETRYMIFDIPLWFLTCLFITEILYFWVSKLSSRLIYKIISLFVMGLCGYLTTLYLPFRLPWGLDVALTAIVFYGIGHIFQFIKFNMSKKKQALLFILFLILNIKISQINGQIDMATNHYQNIVLFYISALIGIGLFIILIVNIKKHAILTFLGENSLLILALHNEIYRYKLNVLFYKLQIFNSIHYKLFWGFAYSVTAIIICIPIIYIVNNYFPFIVGKPIQKREELLQTGKQFKN